MSDKMSWTGRELQAREGIGKEGTMDNVALPPTSDGAGAHGVDTSLTVVRLC